jgi:hypothetical protein
MYVCMEAVYSSETVVTTYKSTRRYNPEDQHQHLHRRKKMICTNFTSAYISRLTPLIGHPYLRSSVKNLTVLSKHVTGNTHAKCINQLFSISKTSLETKDI